MTIINTFKKSFKTIIENPSITLFFVLFLILSNFITTYVVTSKNIGIATILSLCLFMLSCSFLSGWFQIIKESFDIEKLKEKKFSSVFFEGVGKNIVSITTGVILCFIIFNLALILLRIFALKVFGNLDFISQDMAVVPQDAESLTKYLQSLPTDKIYAIYGWACSGLVIMSIFSFLFLFYMPAIIKNEKHNIFLKPIIAIKDCICFAFKNFFGALGIYALISVLYLLLTIFSALTANNTILSILVLFIYIYFVSFFIMLIFNYYEQKNNSSNRTDSIRENECINSTSEEI